MSISTHLAVTSRRGWLIDCADAGYDFAVLVGDPAYYTRFGFHAAKARGLDNEYGVIDEFMVLELRKGSLDRVRGLVRYAPEFAEA